MPARQPPLFESQLEQSGLSRIEFAVSVYRNRNMSKAELEARRNAGIPFSRLLFHPVGFRVGPKIPGQQQLWIPHPLEVRPCCQVITPPVQKYPWGYHRHCRSLRHIAMLLNVDERELTRLVKVPRLRCSCGRFLKEGNYACGKCLWKNRQDGLDKQAQTG
jgi:hypothetical protein